MSVDLYIKTSFRCSGIITKTYSTSFSIATSFLERDKRDAIHAIYGFVRTADEVVDSFHGYDKEYLLNRLEEDLNYALENGLSTNIVVNAFATTIKKYNINFGHVEAFLGSMKSDLTNNDYTTQADLARYIYGSADVIGLMCLKVFCNGNQELYNKLEDMATKFGTVLQKVNFFRDLKNDLGELGRSYFPEITGNKFDVQTKASIEKVISLEFQEAWDGIKLLPGRSKFSVALVYFYYLSLFKKIVKSSPERLLSERVRVPNFKKWLIYLKVWLMYVTRMI